MKKLFLILPLLLAASPAFAATLTFTPLPGGNVHIVNSDDSGGPFQYGWLGYRQGGGGQQGGGNADNTLDTVSGAWGAVPSEWISSFDQPTINQDPPCSLPVTYTGDPETDFASCIAAINLDGGTYAVGVYTPPTPPPPSDSWMPDPTALLAAVTSSVQQTASSIWGMLPFLGVPIAFVIAIWVIEFIRHSTKKQRKESRRYQVGTGDEYDPSFRSAFVEAVDIENKAHPDS